MLEIKEKGLTSILYESPYKLLKTLQSIHQNLGPVRVSICRELTKIHETVETHSVEHWLEIYDQRPLKGEMVLVLHLADKKCEEASHE